MNIIGKVRSVRVGEGIECHHCDDDASHSVETAGKFSYYCQDHFDDLKNNALKPSPPAKMIVASPVVQTELF